MKLILKHHHHQPSASFIALVNHCLESLRADLRIDEARLFLERRLEASPAFRVSAHLVTPGPDVFAEAVDHTLHAALQKTIVQLKSRIGHRHLKRARRAQNHFKTGSQALPAVVGARN